MVQPMDLTPLKTALRTRLGFESLTATSSPKQIRLTGRMPQPRMGDYLIFIHHIYEQWLKRKNPGWTMDASKHYFTHPQTGKVVFEWRYIFGAEEIEKCLPDIHNAVLAAPGSSRVEVMEVPLIGAGPNRNAHNARGKGVGLTDKTPTGPLAVAALSRQGG
jgi:hypothetical protein